MGKAPFLILIRPLGKSPYVSLEGGLCGTGIKILKNNLYLTEIFSLSHTVERVRHPSGSHFIGKKETLQGGEIFS